MNVSAYFFVLFVLFEEFLKNFESIPLGLGIPNLDLGHKLFFILSIIPIRFPLIQQLNSPTHRILEPPLHVNPKILIRWLIKHIHPHILPKPRGRRFHDLKIYHPLRLN